jgi:hypothetical protein
MPSPLLRLNSAIVLKVWRKPAGQPHQFNIALALPLQASARLHPIEITVDIDLEQHGRVVRRLAGARRRGSFESEGCQFEFFDECVNNPHSVVFSDEVIETLWQ